MVNVDLDKTGMNCILLVASFTEMWAAGSKCDSDHNGEPGNCADEYGYAIAMGVISVFFSIVLLLINRFAPGVASGVVEMVIVIPLFILWFTCMAVCTMDGAVPFGGGGTGAVANGYFCTWLCVVLTWVMVLEYSPQIKGLFDRLAGAADDEKTILLAVGGSSFIEMWSAAKLCDDAGSCTGINGWAVSAGVISLLTCLVFGLAPPLSGMIKFSAIFLAIWWLAALLTLTMPNKDNQGPFIATGNGYCATWVACFASVFLCAECWGGAAGLKRDEGTDESAPVEEGGLDEAIPPPVVESPPSPPADVPVSDSAKA